MDAADRGPELAPAFDGAKITIVLRPSATIPLDSLRCIRCACLKAPIIELGRIGCDSLEPSGGDVWRSACW